MSKQRSNQPVAAIVGVGLIGGSLGMAWKMQGVVREVVGVARRPETIDQALQIGAIDRGTLSLEEGVADADIVILAVPVRSVVPVYERMRPVLRKHAIVSDVGSTKKEICDSIWQAGPACHTFIGGHPMAGSEQEGVLSADPYLFENAVYVLTPQTQLIEDMDDGISESAANELGTLRRLVEAIGATPLIMPADRHDSIVAAVSHLPHMVAASLVKVAADLDDEIPGVLKLAAGGFRDTTRVASGPESIWTDIALSNAEPLIRKIDRMQDALDDLKQALTDRDAERISKMLSRARSVREEIPAKAKGILSTVFDVVVQVVDRPGSIRDVATLLGDAGVNIIDIEILRVREGEGGTLRLGFERREEMEKALVVLADGNYPAVYRG